MPPKGLETDQFYALWRGLFDYILISKHKTVITRELFVCSRCIVIYGSKVHNGRQGSEHYIVWGARKISIMSIHFNRQEFLIKGMWSAADLLFWLTIYEYSLNKCSLTAMKGLFIQLFTNAIHCMIGLNPLFHPHTVLLRFVENDDMIQMVGRNCKQVQAYILNHRTPHVTRSNAGNCLNTVV